MLRFVAVDDDLVPVLLHLRDRTGSEWDAPGLLDEMLDSLGAALRRRGAGRVPLHAVKGAPTLQTQPELLVLAGGRVSALLYFTATNPAYLLLAPPGAAPGAAGYQRARVAKSTVVLRAEVHDDEDPEALRRIAEGQQQLKISAFFAA